MDVEAAKQIFSAGEYLEQDGRIEQAIACYRQATYLHPEHNPYHYRLGTILRQQNKLELAIQSFDRAIAIYPEDSWSHHALGEIYTTKQDFPQAISYYRKAIQLNANFSWSHYNLGRLFDHLKQFSNAYDCYLKATEIESDFSWSHFFLAEVANTLNRELVAIDHYQKAVDLEPIFDQAFYQLGQYSKAKKELNKAIEYYYQAIKTNPEEYNYYYYLVETLIQLEKSKEAIEYSEKLIELQPENLQGYYYLGKILINQGETATADYRSLAKEHSQLFQVNLEIGLAQAWQKTENFERSIECCKNAIRIDPTAKMPFNILQYIPTNKKNIEEIIGFYQQIGKSNQACPLLWGNLGDLLTEQARIEEAINCYRTSCYENIMIKNPQLAELDWSQNKQNSPDFIIIGASKCGTTSLFSYLNENPQILAPHKKEINFFNQNFDLGLPWYLAQFPAIADLPGYITGEASPFYIYDLRAIDRIKQAFPDIKLIAMLRNPIERTISEYYHAINHGVENRSLEELIAREKEQLATMDRGEAMQVFGYLLNSIYVEKLAQWVDRFSRENILIIESESFFQNTPSIMEEVYSFLDVPVHTNNNHIPYNVGTYPSISPNTREKLKNFFIPYNQELETYLGRKFNW